MKRRGPECMDDVMAWKKEELLRGEKAGEGYEEAGHLTVLATVAEREDLPVYSHHPLIHSKRTVQYKANVPLFVSSYLVVPHIIHPL
jgi:hypothetical protein